MLGSLFLSLFFLFFIFTYNKNAIIKLEKNSDIALAGVAHWIKCRPANQRVAG